MIDGKYCLSRLASETSTDPSEWERIDKTNTYNRGTNFYYRHITGEEGWVNAHEDEITIGFWMRSYW